MIEWHFNEKEPLKILCLGAHCDDIEIGCGGTLLKLFDAFPVASVSWIVFCSNEERSREARASASEFLAPVAHRHIEIKAFRDGFLPYEGYKVKEAFESIKKAYSPNLIFTHFRRDLHQDHRKINELTWNTFRNHLILEYEILKYDGDLGQPNLYCQLAPELVEKKIDIICRHYSTQSGKQWFDPDTFQSLMRIRGVESASTTRFAEAFYANKMVL